MRCSARPIRRDVGVPEIAEPADCAREVVGADEHHVDPLDCQDGIVDRRP
jgi:hypothetical protein